VEVDDEREFRCVRKIDLNVIGPPSRKLMYLRDTSK
jgi:hypothetical protein